MPKLALQLSLKQKPLATSLLTQQGYYRPKAVANALNACRLHGHAQLLVATAGDFSDPAMKEVSDRETDSLRSLADRVKQEVDGMSLEQEPIEVEIKAVHPLCLRIDLRLKQKNA